MVFSTYQIVDRNVHILRRRQMQQSIFRVRLPTCDLGPATACNISCNAPPPTTPISPRKNLSSKHDLLWGYFPPLWRLLSLRPAWDKVDVRQYASVLDFFFLSLSFSMFIFILLFSSSCSLLLLHSYRSFSFSLFSPNGNIYISLVKS